MKTIVRVGVDIAKNVLQVHAVDAQGVDFHAELTRNFHLKLTHPLA